MTLSEAHDSAVPPEVQSIGSGDALQSGGSSTRLFGSVDYARNRYRLQLFGKASTSISYYPSFDRAAAKGHDGELGAGVRLAKQGSLRISQRAAYSPSYLYQLFPVAASDETTDTSSVNSDYRIRETASYVYGTRMALEFGSTRGTRVTTTADYTLTDFRHQTEARPNLTTHAATAKVEHGVSGPGRVSAEYEYRSGEFLLGVPAKTHEVTMGLEYTPPLSITRRATFRLEVSPSLLVTPELALRDVEQRVFLWQGEAVVEYPFRRKWQATARYRRGIEYLAVLSGPVLSSGAWTTLTGVIGRRVDISAEAGYANGGAARSLIGRDLVTYTGDARVRYALARTMALYSECLYYYYDLRGQARLPPGIPTVYETLGIRVGFTLFGQALGK